LATGVTSHLSEGGNRGRGGVVLEVEPTLELVLQPPEVGTDPLAALVITLAALWIFGGPWLRLCWWLGTRSRESRVAPALSPAPTDILPATATAPVQRTVRFAVLVVALGAGLATLRR
jgi:hypothetical protein